MYTHLDDANNRGTLALELDHAIAQLQPSGLVMAAPGDWRVLQSLRAVAVQRKLPLDLRDDTHLYGTVRDFAEHAKARKQLRNKHGILMEGKDPMGGQWNFDADNRESFGKAGPQNVPQPTLL